MKKLMALMGLVVASSAFAQTWDAGDGNLTLVDVTESKMECTVTLVMF